MRFDINKLKFTTILETFSSIVKDNNLHNINNYVSLSIKDKVMKFEIYSEHYYCYEVASDITEECEILLPVRKLLGILSELSAGMITLDINNNFITLSQGKTKYVLITPPFEDPYKIEDDNVEYIEISSSAFLVMLQKVKDFTFNKNLIGILSNICIKKDSNKFIAIATDQIRVAYIERFFENSVEDFQITLSPQSIEAVIYALKYNNENDNDKLRIGYNNGKLHIQFNGYYFILITGIGAYPGVMNALAEYFNSECYTFDINRECLISGLRKVLSLFKDDKVFHKVVKLTTSIKRHELNLETVSDEHGVANDSIEITSLKGDFELGVDINYFLSCLNKIDSEIISIRTNSKDSRVIEIKDRDREDYIYYVFSFNLREDKK